MGFISKQSGTLGAKPDYICKYLIVIEFIAVIAAVRIGIEKFPAKLPVLRILKKRKNAWPLGCKSLFSFLACSFGNLSS